MRIEVLTTFLHGPEKWNEGDVRTVSDELGAYFCRAGWAKDLDGNVPTETPKTDEVILAPHGVTHGHDADNVGA